MRRTAMVVLAASLILPLSLTRASSEGAGPTAPGAATSGPTWKLFAGDLPPALRLPEEVQSLSPKEREAALQKHLVEVYQSWRRLRSEWPGAVCLAASREDADLCATAARISQSRPCLAAGDCPALEEWKEVMGTPGLRPAPRSMVRAADRSRPEPPEQH